MSCSLTDILLQEASAERCDALLVELGGDAAIRVPPSNDIVAYFVLDGQIIVTGDQLEPTTIKRGEYGLLLYGTSHRVHASGNPSSRNDHLITEWPVGDEPSRLVIGQEKRAAKFISVALRTIYSPIAVRSQHPLAELLHFADDSRPLFSDAVLLTDIAQIELAIHGPGANAFITALMNLHFFHAFRCGYFKMKRAMPLLANPTDVVRSPSVRPVAVAVRLLDTHPERHWTVAKLAQELGQSRSSFAANFRSCVGVGPMEYLNNIRMEKARELVQNRRDLSLCAIGRQVGYDNVSSFARAFKTHFGASPRGLASEGGISEVSSSTECQPAPAEARLASGEGNSYRYSLHRKSASNLVLADSP